MSGRPPNKSQPKGGATGYSSGYGQQTTKITVSTTATGKSTPSKKPEQGKEKPEQGKEKVIEKSEKVKEKPEEGKAKGEEKHYREEYRRLKSENDVLVQKSEDEIKELQEESAGKDGQIAELKNSIDAKNDELKQQHNEIANKCEELDRIKAELMAELKQKKDEIINSCEELERVKSLLRSSMEKKAGDKRKDELIIGYNERTTELLTIKKGLEADLQQIKEKERHLQQQMEEMDKHNENLSKKNEDLGDQLQAQKTDKVHRQKQVDDLSSNNDALCLTIADLNKQKRQTEKENHLQQQMEEMVKQNEDLGRQNEDLSKRNEDLSKRNEDIGKQNEDFLEAQKAGEVHCQEQEEKMGQLNITIKRVTAEIAQLRSSDKQFKESEQRASVDEPSPDQSMEEQLMKYKEVYQNLQSLLEEEKRKNSAIEQKLEKIQHLEHQRVSFETNQNNEDTSDDTRPKVSGDYEVSKQQFEQLSLSHKSLEVNYQKTATALEGLKVKYSLVKKERNSVRQKNVQLNESQLTPEIHATHVQTRSESKLLKNEVEKYESEIQRLKSQIEDMRKGESNTSVNSEHFHHQLVASEGEDLEKEQTITELREQLQSTASSQDITGGASGPTGEDNDGDAMCGAGVVGEGMPAVSIDPEKVSALEFKVEELEKSVAEDREAKLAYESKVDQLMEEVTAERKTKLTLQETVDKLQKDAEDQTGAWQKELDKMASEIQQLQKENKQLQVTLQTECKGRDDRIEELEDFIRDQTGEMDKMEEAIKKLVESKNTLHVQYKKLEEYYSKAKDIVMTRETDLLIYKDKIAVLEAEKDAAVKTNIKMSGEVGRLMQLDTEFQAANETIEKCKKSLFHVQNELQTNRVLLQSATDEIEKHKVSMRKAEEELQTKEFMVNTYKEDFIQERKDREHAHHIKEEEIEKMRVKLEEFKAHCQEKVENVKGSMQQELATYKAQANQFANENKRIKREYEQSLQTVESLRTNFTKEKKHLTDLSRRKTEEYTTQWKQREQAQKAFDQMSGELHAQKVLNTQQQASIDNLLRKTKGIEHSGIGAQNLGNQRTQHPSAQTMPAQSMDTGPPANQYDQSQQQPYSASQYTPEGHPVAYPTNADTSHGQQVRYPMPPHQEGHLRAQGRGQDMAPVGREHYYPPPQQQQGYIPPTHPQVSQPMSLDRSSLDHKMNRHDTNAATREPVAFLGDQYGGQHAVGREYGGGPLSLGSSKMAKHNHPNYPSQGTATNAAATPSWRSPEKPPQQVEQKQFSEGINEEIRLEANKQRQQPEQQQEFSSDLPLDPYLICPKCNLQFFEGQLPEFKKHTNTCQGRN